MKSFSNQIFKGGLSYKTTFLSTLHNWRSIFLFTIVWHNWHIIFKLTWGHILILYSWNCLPINRQTRKDTDVFNIASKLLQLCSLFWKAQKWREFVSYFGFLYKFLSVQKSWMTVLNCKIRRLILTHITISGWRLIPITWLHQKECITSGNKLISKRYIYLKKMIDHALKSSIF